MAKYTNIPNNEESIGLVSELGTTKKEFKVFKVACIGLCLIGAYMLGVSMSVGSNAQGALMVSNVGGECGRVSSIQVGGYPDEFPKFGPECTEIGEDTKDLCIPKGPVPGIIATMATALSALSPFPQKFTTKSCASQGFDIFNRNVDVSGVIGIGKLRAKQFKIPNNGIVKVYRKRGQNENIFGIRNVKSGSWLGGLRSQGLSLYPKKNNFFCNWKFEFIEENFYAIKNVGVMEINGLYLDGRSDDYEGQDFAPELANADRKPFTDYPGRFLLWTVEEFGDYYALKSVTSGLYLAPGTATDSLQLTRRPPTASDNFSLWEIVAAEV